jgi:oligoendopeptidase F
MKAILLVLFFGLVTTACGEENCYLQSIYPDQNAWQQERDDVIGKLKTIGHLKDSMTKSAKNFADAMQEISNLRAQAGRLAVYGFLVSDADMNSKLAKKQYEAGNMLETQVEAAISFMNGAIVAVGKQRIEQWMIEEPGLSRFRARFNRIFAEAKYSLSPESDAILQSAERWPVLSGDVFEALHESDLEWPGKIDRAGYLKLRTSADSETRITLMSGFLNWLQRLQEVFGILYTRRIEADLQLAKRRGFSDGIEALWFLRDGMPAGSFQVMITETRRHMDLFRRYAKLRAQAIGSKHPSYPDLYAPMNQQERSFSIDQARSIALDASSGFGKEYVTALRDLMNQRWMNLAPLPQKRNTYAIWPPVGGIPPFFIMSYQGTYDHARRFLGGVTLMMSFNEWRKANAPDTRDDPGIYSNGVIYAGDLLFDDYMIKNAKNRDEQISALINSLDLLRHHYFQWAMNSEFDARVQAMIVRGEFPSGKTLSEMYLKILQEYYGPSDEGVEIDSRFGNEWMINSVPFSSYEHQFWPAAMATGINIVEGLHANDPRAAKAVWEVLGRSDTDRTYGLLKQAGIDLTSPAGYEPVFGRMRRLLAQLDALLNHS